MAAKRRFCPRRTSDWIMLAVKLFLLVYVLGHGLDEIDPALLLSMVG